MILAAAASALAFTATQAAAQEASYPAVYGNLGYSFVDGGSNITLGAVNARVGGRLHKYFGVEGEGALGVDSDTTTVSGVPVKVKLKHSFAAYAVGFLPLAPNFDVFVRGGYGSIKLSASALGATVSDSDDSWNYGAGGQYLFDGKNGVRVDFTRHDYGGGHANVWSAAYVRNF
jgi:hypothetical protein